MTIEIISLSLIALFIIGGWPMIRIWVRKLICWLGYHHADSLLPVQSTKDFLDVPKPYKIQKFLVFCTSCQEYIGGEEWGPRTRMTFMEECIAEHGQEAMDKIRADLEKDGFRKRIEEKT